MMTPLVKQILSVSISILIGVACYFFGLSLRWAIILASLPIASYFLLSSWSSSSHVIKPKRRLQPFPSHLSPIEKAIGYKYGRFGLPRDVKNAFKLLSELACLHHGSNSQEINESMYELADCYERGIGTKTCITSAIHCYKQCYLNGLLSQRDRLRRYNSLIERLVGVMQTKASHGDTESMYALGFYYRHQHLQSESSANQKYAFDWFSSAAEQNHRQATIELANCYYNGIGTDKDFKVAEKYYRTVVYEFGLVKHTPALIGCLVHQYRREEVLDIIKSEKEKASPSKDILDMEETLIACHLLSKPDNHNPNSDHDSQNHQLDQLITLEHGKLPDYNLYGRIDSEHISDISLDSTADILYQSMDETDDLSLNHLQSSRSSTPNSLPSRSLNLSFLSPFSHT